MRNATIYPTMWAPPNIKGVPRDFGLVVLVFVGLAIPILGILLALPVAALLWGVGMIMGRRDPEFLTIIIVSKFRIGKTLGEFAGNEYTP